MVRAPLRGPAVRRAGGTGKKSSLSFGSSRAGEGQPRDQRFNKAVLNRAATMAGSEAEQVQ
jgi:hypothetical protein